MPWLTDLDVALRSGGIGFWADPDWRGRGQAPMSGVRAIMIHHTAGGGSNDWKLVRDGRAGLRGLLSQMTFERDGGVRLLGAGQAWHAGTGYHPRVGRNNANAWTIGIEGVSRGVDNDWTPAQRREYPRVAAALCRHYGLPADAVIGHKEWAPTRKIDPGDWDMAEFRADVRRHLARLSGPAPATPPAVTPKDDLMIMDKTFLAPGHNDFRLTVPVGTAAAPWALAEAVLSIVSNGTVTGTVYVQDDKRGIVNWPIKVTNTAGICDRFWKYLPTGATQLGIVLDAPIGGTVTIEGREK